MRILIKDPLTRKPVEYFWCKPDRVPDEFKEQEISNVVAHAFALFEMDNNKISWEDLRDHLLWSEIFAKPPKEGTDISDEDTIEVDCTTELFCRKVDYKLSIFTRVKEKIQTEMMEWLVRMVDPVTDETVVVAFNSKRPEKEIEHDLGVQMSRAAVEFAKTLSTSLAGERLIIDNPTWNKIRDLHLHSIGAKVVEDRYDELKTFSWTLADLIKYNDIVQTLIDETTKKEEG